LNTPQSCPLVCRGPCAVGLRPGCPSAAWSGPASLPAAGASCSARSAPPYFLRPRSRSILSACACCRRPAVLRVFLKESSATRARQSLDGPMLGPHARCAIAGSRAAHRVGSRLEVRAFINNRGTLRYCNMTKTIPSETSIVRPSRVVAGDGRRRPFLKRDQMPG
jgi:hypothetical protein